MIVAFKRSAGGGLVSRGIDLLSGGDGYCHVEIMFSDGMSFSSTTLDDGPDGVRFRRLDYSHPERWTFFDVPVSAEREARIRTKAEEIDGAPYDTVGVLRFVAPWMQEHPTRYFCSEACLEAFQAAPLFLDLGEPWENPPNRWARHLERNGYRRIRTPWPIEQEQMAA